ncbi:MAG: FlgD immunoglobulin-like domain containing protein, partial [bacterium]|nr:FlgD immunoglobulin-like domain containing protein [bacterium]
LELLFQVIDILESVQTAQAEQSNLVMSGYFGKHVVTTGSGFEVAYGAASGAKYELQASSARGELAVYDGTGALVRRMELGPREPGTYDVQWDARDMDLNTVPDGPYRFQINFYDQDDSYIPTQTYQTNRVEGLVFENGRTLLDLGDSRVVVQDVVQVVDRPPVIKAEVRPED